MKILYSWLKEFLPTLEASPEKVAEALTLHSFETVIAKRVAFHHSVTTVKVEKIDPHPNAHRLKLATVTDGTKSIQVVCGATNYKVGDVVPYSPPGAEVFDEEGKMFTVKEATIRGVVSPGMLNSPRELGLGDWHGGLWILPQDTPLGKPLRELIPDDAILEADITPNRAHDCLSHRGVARELAAVLEVPMKDSPNLKLPTNTANANYKIEVEDASVTPRYFGTAVDNISINVSPLRMQYRLLAVGTHPINNVVDITNYVMFELGNPVHLFDRAKLPGQTIGVRKAKPGEKITDLDNIEHTLKTDHLVITGNDQPIALAGVMGGAATGISDATTTGFLEVANFHPFTIQQSARSLNIRTEASARYSKGIDPNLVSEAAARCFELLQQLAGASVAETNDVYPNPVAPKTISFNPKRPAAIAGTPITTEAAKSALLHLRCQVVEAGDTWSVTTPTDRLDLNGEHDLVEEVVRLFGLSHIPASSRAKIEPATLPASLALAEAVRDGLVKIGFIEVYNYSFENELIAAAFGLITHESLKLVNPVAPEQAYLRQSLLPRLIENVVTNKAEWRKRTSNYSRALFEIGTVFKKGDGGIVPGVVEEQHLAGITHDVPLERVISALKEIFPELETRPGSESNVWEADAMEIILKGEAIGRIGTLSSKALLALHEKLRLKPGLKGFEVTLKNR